MQSKKSRKTADEGQVACSRGGEAYRPNDKEGGIGPKGKRQRCRQGEEKQKQRDNRSGRQRKKLLDKTKPKAKIRDKKKKQRGKAPQIVTLTQGVL